MPRPLSFDPEEKLSQAMLLFWEYGYAETSVSQLVEKLNINKFSLYKQFGDKESLFKLAIEHYNQNVYQTILKPLRELEGKPSLMNYFEGFGNYMTKADEHGCFLNNTLLSGPTLPDSCRDLAKGVVRELISLLGKNFEVAYKTGDLKKTPKEAVNFTSMTIQALLNTQRSIGTKAMMKNLDFFKEMITEW